jgi:hypothetical protein
MHVPRPAIANVPTNNPKRRVMVRRCSRFSIFQPEKVGNGMTEGVRELSRFFARWYEHKEVIGVGLFFCYNTSYPRCAPPESPLLRVVERSRNYARQGSLWSRGLGRGIH